MVVVTENVTWKSENATTTADTGASRHFSDTSILYDQDICGNRNAFILVNNLIVYSVLVIWSSCEWTSMCCWYHRHNPQQQTISQWKILYPQNQLASGCNCWTSSISNVAHARIPPVSVYVYHCRRSLSYTQDSPSKTLFFGHCINLTPWHSTASYHLIVFRMHSSTNFYKLKPRANTSMVSGHSL